MKELSLNKLGQSFNKKTFYGVGEDYVVIIKTKTNRLLFILVLSHKQNRYHAD